MSCADPVSQFSPSSLRMHNANELLSPCRSAAEDPAFSFHRQTPKRASTSVFTSPTSSPRPVLSDILHMRYKSSPKGPGCRPRTCYKENFEVTNTTQECKADDAVDEVLCSSGLKINRRNTENGTNLSFSRSPFSSMGETFSSPPQKTYEGSKSCDLKLVASRKLGANNEPVDASCSPQTPSSFKRKRPIKLEVPEFARLASFDKAKEFTFLTDKPVASEIDGIDGHSFAVAFKSGRRDCMQDAHVVITNFQKKPDQAVFGIFDGHGGKRVAEFLSQNLIHHIEEAIQDLNGGKDCLGSALRASYMSADAEIADKGLEGGACTISAFLREGQLLVANAGDCKAVLCREGKAEVLSSIHRASNAKERERIQNLGGYVDCFSGTWRVQGTLAVTRSLGDTRMKTWITGEPEVVQLEINKECEFLILASDGLWDKVSDQDAVDCVRRILQEHDECDISPSRPCKVLRKDMDESIAAGEHTVKHKTTFSSQREACNELIHKACNRGNLDDITVMVVPLVNFVQPLTGEKDS